MSINERGIVTVNILGSANETDIVIVTASTVYTKTFRIDDGEYFAMSYKTSAVGGSANVTLVLEQSYEPPLVEGSAHATYVTPVSQADIVTSLTTRGTWYHTSFSPLPISYARVKITGALLNSNSIVNIKLSQQVNG